MGAKGVNTATDIVKVSLVGVGMRSHAGIASKMFTALAAAGINIRMISTSEIKISVVIEEIYMELEVRQLPKAFGMEEATSVAYLTQGRGYACPAGFVSSRTE